MHSQACAVLTGASPNPEKEQNLFNKKVVGFDTTLYKGHFMVIKFVFFCISYRLSFQVTKVYNLLDYIRTIASFFNRKCIVIPLP